MPESNRDKKFYVAALGQRVLSVAVLSLCGDTLIDWAAYIDSVPGANHHEEAVGVANHGDKLPLKVACALFPYLESSKYRD